MSQSPEPDAPNIRRIPPPALAGRGQASWLAQLARRLQAPPEAGKQNRLASRLEMLLLTLTDYALPAPPERLLLEGEKIELEIRLAEYRNTIPRLILQFWWLGLALTIALTLAIYITTSPLFVPLGLSLPILMFTWALIEKLHYEQWRLIITDRRTIIFMPDPNSWWRVDSIRMGARKIAVIDTNFSRSAWWGLFQTSTGARDLVISMSGYAFKTDRAEVQGGLTIPDIMPEDIRRLEEFIFRK